MKKIIFIVVMAILPITSFAQFTLYDDGFYSDEGKEYVVFDLNGTQEELFKKTKTIITEMMVNADEATSFNEYDIISLSMNINRITVFKWVGKKYYWDCTAHFKILFKDNKIRINAPTFDSKFQRFLGKGKRNGFIGENYLFKENGEPYYNSSVDDIENKINEIINELINNVKGNNIDEW